MSGGIYERIRYNAQALTDFAEGLLTAFTSLLNQWPIAYTLRIDAGESTVLRHSHSPAEPLAAQRGEPVTT